MNPEPSPALADSQAVREIEVDVTIVGYGPVGAACAAFLGRYGIRTLVVDRAPDVLMAPRAIALDNEALRILQMAGLAEDDFDKVVIPHVRMHCPYVGEFSRIETTGSIDGHPKLVTFYQPDLERALRRHAEASAQVQAMTQIEMLSFDADEHGVRTQLRRADGTPFTARSRYLIGADGAASNVRRSIGQEFTGRTYAEDWLVIDAFDVPGSFDHVEFICDHRRPVPHMVAPGGRTRWEFMLRAGETREQMESDETIKRLLAPWVPNGEARIERKAVYRFHARSCERYSVGRVFLAGDAAHITPPFVGQGLVSGLRDAANLSWKLAWVLKGYASPRILDSYDEERRPHATKMINLARQMGQLVMPRNAPLAMFVHGTMALLRRVPPLRTFLDNAGVKPKNVFPRGLFVRGRGRLRRGAQIPQAHVRAQDGRVLLSDDAFGPSLTLVGFGRDPLNVLDAPAQARWRAHGGAIVQIVQRGAGRTDPHVFEDLHDALLPGAAPYGWCAVLRPDRTVVIDGPVESAAQLVEAALALIDATA
ncbi:bifunctional 3-(3-hydroxy-phenyl)propionate/3-hydroxycinnamic acid hydroxylase [Solimonas marina]|uniref:Bifunctional 3-(3-hydroxy-phenyl)propionate/3-hydroxycinnamic acid hydroxylase n=1 Tax=Solimonas marina TaxID=2714601 RepID=A0A969WBK9_9GAMM|nr:bifunctional 3-(3-hydroxy-phenyl)propionate/3-hydroxycinnamic acid hydroxylase [Solimonas marina]NKF23534.1 bifunctional 3-(3-hydroxy-phenyl)propionate/3-hydroxycinnamic acid hydroxylase [Solimonas marina]